MEKMKEVLNRIPIVNLIPILEDIATRIPTAYAALSDEQKQAVAAGAMKLLADYGKSK